MFPLSDLQQQLLHTGDNSTNVQLKLPIYLFQAVNSNRQSSASCYSDSSSDKHTTSTPQPFVAGAVVALGASPLNPRLAVSHASSDKDPEPDGGMPVVMEGIAVFEPATCKAGFGAGGTRCAR